MSTDTAKWVKAREIKHARITIVGLALLGAAMLMCALLSDWRLELWQALLVGFGAFLYIFSYSSLLGEGFKIGMLPPAIIGCGCFVLGLFTNYLFSVEKSIIINIILWLCLVVWAIVVLVSLALFLLIFTTSLNTVRRSDKDITVIVLGCKVKGDKPTKMLEERLITAKKLLDKRPELLCIVSGGIGEGQEFAEADVMCKWLLENNISAQRIIVENRSATTYENFVFSKKIIEEKGLAPVLAIVSDRFHQYRASHFCKDLGMSCRAVNRETTWYLSLQYWFREMLCILEMWVKGAR